MLIVLIQTQGFVPGEISLAWTRFDGLLARVGQVDVEARVPALGADGLAFLLGFEPVTSGSMGTEPLQCNSLLCS